ncbi:MAG: hypothetical protein V4505_15350 [Pseudomonadota bacterium]
MGILLRVRSEDYGRNAPQPDASLDLGPAIPEATDLDALRAQTVQLLLGQRLLQATTGAALQAPSIPGIAGGAFDENGDAYAVPLDPQGRGSSSADGDAAIQVSAKRMTPEEMAAFDAAHPELAEEINAAADRRPSGSSPAGSGEAPDTVPGGSGAEGYQLALDRLSRSEADDRAFYDHMVDGASSAPVATLGILGRALNGAGHDIAKSGVGIYGLATSGAARWEALHSLGKAANSWGHAITHPVETARGQYEAGRKYLDSHSLQQMGEDGARLLAANLATEGWGKPANAVANAVGDVTDLTGKSAKALRRWEESQRDVSKEVPHATAREIDPVEPQASPPEKLQPGKPRAYSTVFEMRLDPKDFGRSRKVHYHRANMALHQALESDPEFAAMMEHAMPGVRSAVSSVGRRKTPAGWTWEHASTKTTFDQEAGVMRLVPRSQHTAGSPWWRVLHPDRGAAGGYAEWAIPAGAPENQRRKK